MSTERIRLSAGEDAGVSAGAPTAHEQVGLLVSRIADGEACASDWEAFGALAQRFPNAWQELATAQRDHASLSVAVGVALHAADRVELPSADGARRFVAGHDVSTEIAPARILFWSRARTWGGWAAAAVLVLAWSSGQLTLAPRHQPSNQATIVPSGWQLDTPDDAVNAYLTLGGRTGSVVGELPQRVMIEAHPATSGDGVEVTYLRQFIEKRTYKDMVKFAGTDEAGRSLPMRYQPEAQPEAPQ